MKAAVAVLALVACGRIGFAKESDVETSIDATLDVDAIVIAPANRAFVTSNDFTGALGGLLGADARCQTAADNAGLGGTWIARLGTSAEAVETHLAGARGWRDIDGLPIADEPTDWTEGRLINPLRRDEFGMVVAADRAVWTGTIGGDCAAWTSSSSSPTGGIAFAGDSIIGFAARICSGTGALYCVERDVATPVEVPDLPGRLAFVSEGEWVANSGRANADARCAAEAAAASLPGTYLALLAAPGQPAGARFNAAGLPWKRVDGVPITSTAAELIGPTPASELLSFINRTAAGAPMPGTLATWLRIGSAADHCANWSSVSERAERLGSHSVRRIDLAGGTPSFCDGTSRIVCLQE